jgi:uncharacterized protein (TIGR02996 family)
VPRYEFTGGSSNKFWEIKLDGSSFTTTYGRIGTDGQTTIKEFDSEDKARKEHDKLVASKVKKGYVLVSGGGGGAAPAAKKVAKKKAVKKEAAPKQTAARASGGDALRYELSDGKSNKFWEIKLEGTSFTTTYGRIGTGGQTSIKEYDSEDKAQKEYDKLIASKVKKGYELVSGGGAAPKATPKKKTAAAQAPAPGSSQSQSGGPRYELVDGKSSKFWEIKLEGKSFSTTYGRIGTDGKTTTKEFGSAAEARQEHDKLVAQKTKKGYALVSGGTGPGATAKSDPKLEAAILKDRDNPEAYLVYADWLQTQGDPRGELITVQHGLLEDPKNAKLRKAEAKLLADHGEHFIPKMLGEMLAKEKPKKKDWRHYKLDSGFCHAEWYCGFLKSVVLGREGEEDPHSLQDLVSELLAHPSARFLQELRIGALGIYDEYNYGKVVDALTRARPASLRSFRMADFNMEDSELSWSHLGNLGKLIKAMPDLEHLALRGGSMTLGALDLPKLKSFRVETGGLDGGCIKSIVGATWPKLESLHIYFGAEDYGAGGNVKKIAPILEGQGLKKLKHLGLMNAEFTNQICQALPGSKILKQLETLDLSLGTMDDEGARAIADNAKAFRHLKRINLDQNFISKEGEKLLKDAKLEVSMGGQEEPDDWGEGEFHRYVTVGE